MDDTIDNLEQTRIKQKQSEFLLFENPDNLPIKEGLDEVMATFVNPFTEMRLWLMYEEVEIEGLLETFQQRKLI